jgi:hypothetical protein
MAVESNKCYYDLQDTGNNVFANDMLMIMDDLNASVGRNQQKHIEKSSVEPFTMNVENENGTRFIDFYEINDII